MELRDYIDPDEGREDVTASAAVNVCENCGKACETLIDLPSWNFKACPTCAEDAAREDARAAASNPVHWVLSRTAPHFTGPRYAVIGNGLFVRTAAKKRRSR